VLADSCSHYIDLIAGGVQSHLSHLECVCGSVLPVSKCLLHVKLLRSKVKVV